ncbi:hypothetical protein KAFR_0C04240 [Kazachstania africana CBS 2517]|uniref:NADP-dependent oxidoreductase domain-containing protein n=1 Tax=Kazachstania africana (strain ATCC 22294 / BCRC 22015 / CBS 2517 / CECT 1963 / NBRC 1671 / NRRL Y-8276) TaxID=1071382 RepID=H2ASR5_KAZAF|nr:hypothetical protein KAFR_0C04240 [Kazachstania africana CBS 2517]CCF57415.1 hypothetical protein KAFR_0C04240 [Kazachstania africana CBS 2517]
MSLVKQVPFGNTGIKISPIVVGCMSFGSKRWQAWIEDDREEAFKILKYCYDHGLRTFDTADVYSNGESEKFLGEFLKRYNIRRETVVILTKVYFPVDDELPEFGGFKDLAASEQMQLDVTNQRGLSRKHILAGVAKSVERLGTYIDVLQLHRLDHGLPMKEIMRSLNDVVMSGNVRYIGASTMLATEFVEMQYIAEKYNWFQFVSWQSQYNLLYREDEREVIPFAKKHNIALIPWSPNARGILTRPNGVDSDRSSIDPRLQNLPEQDKQIIDRVEKVARDRGVSMAMVSTAWVLSKGCSPIVGLNSIERVQEAIEAVNLKLNEAEIKFLEEPYHTKPLEPIFN